jgi:hypothetical protein
MTPHLGLGVFHSDATCRLEALVCGSFAFAPLSGAKRTEHNAR